MRRDDLAVLGLSVGSCAFWGGMAGGIKLAILGGWLGLAVGFGLLFLLDTLGL